MMRLRLLYMIMIVRITYLIYKFLLVKNKNIFINNNMNMSGDFMKDFGLNNSATSSSTENKAPEQSPLSSASIDNSQGFESPISSSSSSNSSIKSLQTVRLENPTQSVVQTEEINEGLKMSISSIKESQHFISHGGVNKQTIEDLSMNTVKFEKLFDCFKNVNVQSKLWFSQDNSGNFIITVDNGLDIFGVSNLIPTTFSPFRSTARFLCGQNRDKTYNILKSQFEEYMRFLTYIITLIEGDCDSKKEIIVFGDRNKELIREIVVGLYEIKKTYSDFKKIPTLIDSIITTFTDFNSMYDDVCKKNHNLKIKFSSNTRLRSDSF